MIKVYLFLINILLILVHTTNAQPDTLYQGFQEIIELLAEESEEDSDNNELYDRLEYLVQNPIDLNKATIHDLLKIPFLDQVHADLIISRRNKFGLFFSIYELFAIRDIPPDAVTRIIPFLTIAESKTENIGGEHQENKRSYASKTRFRFRSRVMSDLQTRRGFSEKRYEGSKLKNYNRLSIHHENKYQFGILTDKDPGEASYNDFASLYFMVKDLPLTDAIIIGDYLLEFGQGLALWSPYSLSKGSDAVNQSSKKSRGLRPYTSATENGFMRGGAAVLQLNPLSVTLFYSKNNFDAGIDTLSGEIISRPIDGFHRTENEIRRKNAENETVYGSVIQWNPSINTALGFLAYRAKLSRPIRASGKFDLSGDEFGYNSFFYEYYYSRISFFGEFSFDRTSVASINGIKFSPVRDFILTTSFRNYPRNYSNFKGSGFGERAGVTQNEMGFYTGFKWRLPFGILSAYFDQFKFPYRTFTSVSPSEGDEALLEFSTRIFRASEFKLRYKYENKDVTQTINEVRMMIKRLRQSFRIESINNITGKLRLRSRVEYNNFSISLANIKEDGLLLLQDMRINPLKELVLYGRIIFFKTKTFNSAVYEYENDLAGVMTNVPLYGEGFRWYFLIKKNIFKGALVSLKYSETYKPKERSLSSGNNLIPANIDNRISLQIDMSF